MTYTTLISVSELMALQHQGQALAVFDCSFDLSNAQAGAEQYAQGHIPGARYVHLDTALSAKGAADAASGGRHPLPSRHRFAGWAGEQGLTPETQVVVYDRQGLNYCGRLWWMLKWLGHEAVAVLDGGLQAWQAAGGATSTQAPTAAQPTQYPDRAPLAVLKTAQDVAAQLGHPDQTVLDARSAPRYRGETEPLDPVAGHIPGALNRLFSSNLGPDGRLKPAEQLREEFTALLGGRDPASVVHQCGSGVSAVPNLLGMEVAGLGRTALFAGSWSEWCTTAGLPVAQG